MGYHTLKISIIYTKIYIYQHIAFYSSYILVQGHVTSTTRVTEVCHLGHFWLSYGRCAMSGSPTGCLVGLSDDGQTPKKIPEVYYMACSW